MEKLKNIINKLKIVVKKESLMSDWALEAAKQIIHNLKECDAVGELEDARIDWDDLDPTYLSNIIRANIPTILKEKRV